MINKGKSRVQRFCPGQGSNPVPPISQPVVIAMSYNDTSIIISKIIVQYEIERS